VQANTYIDGNQLTTPTSTWTYSECANQCDLGNGGACYGIGWLSTDGRCWLIQAGAVSASTFASGSFHTGVTSGGMAGIALYLPYPYYQYFSSSGTFTATCATCVHTVLAVGGGGGGGGCVPSSSSINAPGGVGGGGAGGSVVVSTFTPSAGSSFTVTVGGSGSGSSGDGNSGGSSSFTSSDGTTVSVTAPGGGGGGSASSGSGTASNGAAVSNGNGGGGAACATGCTEQCSAGSLRTGSGGGSTAGAAGVALMQPTSGSAYFLCGGAGSGAGANAAGVAGTATDGAGIASSSNGTCGAGGAGYTWAATTYGAGGGGGSFHFCSSYFFGPTGGSGGSGSAGAGSGASSCSGGNPGNSASEYGNGGGGGACGPQNGNSAGGSGSAGIVAIQVAAPVGAGRRRALLALGGRSTGLGSRGLLQSCAASVPAFSWTEACVTSPPPLPLPPPGVVAPTIGALAVSPSSAAVNPASQITLSAVVTSAAPPASLTMRWTVVPASALNLSDPTRVGTPLNGATLGLLPGVLAPGTVCIFWLSVSDAFGNTSVSASVTTMSVPTGGTAAASSANGTELVTPFAFTTANWTDANTPLQYAFSFTGDKASTTLLSDFSNSTSVSGVLLPAGTNVVQALARNSLGGVSVSPATVTVFVAGQVFASADAQASFIGALVSSTAAGPLTPADAIATVALVSSIASLLNDPNSALSTNASAAADTRANLLTLVGSAATLATTPEALASAADAVTTLVSNASQISASGAATALSVLEAISGSGAGGKVPISAAASAGVAAGLSSIATAALAPNSPVSPSVLATVANVVGSLATSLLSALTTPGAAPVTVSSPLIQLSVALDTSGPDSRLFSAPLSAPGSKSSFAPLPADIFAGSSRRRRLLADAGVRTQFSSLAFDAHAPNSTAGTTTLAFSTAAGELDISGLSTPIRFTLPLVPLADGLKAQCQFWDPAAASYSIVGCVSLPDPLPPGHNVSWKPGFTVSSDAALAAAWSISGPLMAEPSSCSFDILDCSLPNNTRAVYPNAARPFDFPAVSCDASISTDPILVISGSACALIQQDNAYGCWWSNAKHAFEGAGCVASGGPVQCSCRHLTEFAGKQVPALPTATLSELVSLQPSDLVSRLKTLFIAVVCLFGGMHLGAGVAFLQDAQKRRRLVSKLQLPDVGFEATDGGAWCVHV
jgi:hypothetical protein